MTFLDAAVAVLSNAQRAMTTREITEEALGKGLINTKGKTPEATMAAELYLHVRGAEPPRVRRVFEPGRGRARRGSVRWELG